MESAFKAYEYNGWERSVEKYHSSFSKVTTLTVGPILDALGITQGEAFLDVASGPGYLAAEAAKRGAVATAIDFSDTMVAKGKQTFPLLDIRKGDAEHLGFVSGQFDATALNFGLLHFDRPDAALSEAARVLKPGGRLAFTVWAPPTEALGFGVVLNAVEKHGVTTVDIPKGPPFFKYSDPVVAEEALREAGLGGVRVQKLPLIWELSSPQEFFDAYYHGTPRTGGILRAQEAKRLPVIEEVIKAEVAARFSTDNTVRVPMPAMLYTASRGL